MILTFSEKNPILRSRKSDRPRRTNSAKGDLEEAEKLLGKMIDLSKTRDTKLLKEKHQVI